MLTQDNYLRPRLNGTCVCQLLSMERREENAFAGAHAGDTAEARDSSRPPAILLSGPNRAPTRPDLERFIALLETDPSSQQSGEEGMSVRVLPRTRPCLLLLLLHPGATDHRCRSCDRQGRKVAPNELQAMTTQY